MQKTSLSDRRIEAVRRENDAEQKRKRRRRKPSIAALRIADLNRLFRARYGDDQLPDDDAGRDDLAIMAHHLASLPGNATGRIHDWAKMRAPWCPIAELEQITHDAIRRPRRWKADRLAWRLRLTEQERATLRITTIGAVDSGKGSRDAKRREQNRSIKEAARRAQGIIPRHEYEAKSLSRLQPWKAAGVSRATYYRCLKRSASLSD